MHHRPLNNKICHSRVSEAWGVSAIGGNPKIYVEQRKVQLIMFTYLIYGYIGEINRVSVIIGTLWENE